MKTRRFVGLSFRLRFNILGNTLAYRVAATWNQISNALLQKMSCNNEPQIYSKQNKFGEVVWNVYDPLTGYQASMESEAEVRAWLDRRYYRLP